MSQKAPKAPRKIPAILGGVMRSLTKTAPATRTIIGPLTIMMEAFTGVVIFSPSKKKSMLVVTPKTAQMAKRNRSLTGILKKLWPPESGVSNQKSRAAPVTRNWINARGGTAPCIAALAMRKEEP